jgi:hypothetical protein
MKSTARLILPATSLLSRLLCILSIVFWVRSYRIPYPHGDVLNLHNSDPLWWIISEKGHATLCRQHGRDWGFEWKVCDRFGFRLGGLRCSKGSLWNLQVPYWFLTSVFLLPAMLAPFSYWRSGRRIREGMCAHCGYDIRATPLRCPECGQSIQLMGAPNHPTPLSSLAAAWNRRG